MNPIFQEIQVGNVEHCRNWPIGKCLRANCSRIHHQNLDPGLPDIREHKEYMLPNGTKEACTKCLQIGRECDKKGRSGEFDPCSECRWYGGANGQCELADSSYNDQLFSVMLLRPDVGFTLPPLRDREAQRRGKPDPAPMPATKVKLDWQGESKEQLLAKPDFIPDFVRELPRAYMVPPRVNSWQRVPKGLNSSQQGNYKKRKLDDLSNMASQHMPMPPQYPPMAPLPPMHGHGQVVTSTWTHAFSQWEHTYESGYKLVQPVSVIQPTATPTWYSKHAVSSSGSRSTVSGTSLPVRATSSLPAASHEQYTVPSHASRQHEPQPQPQPQPQLQSNESEDDPDDYADDD